jgi:hypothetical protein
MTFMPQVREPSCIHSHGRQPASACLICKDGPELARWRADWDAWCSSRTGAQLGQKVQAKRMATRRVILDESRRG